MAAGSTLRSWWSKDTVAVVTGSNKGIGYEIARLLAEQGLTVVLTARDPVKGQAATDTLKAQGLQSVAFHPLEVTRPESVQNLATWLKNEFGGLDILVNNAAIASFSDNVDYEAAKLLIETNYYGTRNVTEKLLPYFRPSSAGARIINVTSRAGLYERLMGESLKEKFRDEENYSSKFADALTTKYLEDIKAGRPAEKSWPWVPRKPISVPMYSESKLFLNIYAVALAKSLSKSCTEDHQIFLASYCPGLTRTDMYEQAIAGGFLTGSVPNSPADSADTGVWLALLPKDELTEKHGKFFSKRTEYALGMTKNLPL